MHFPQSPQKSLRVGWGVARRFHHLFIQVRGSLLANSPADVTDILQILLEEKWVPHGDVLGSWALKDACWLPAEHSWVMWLL